MEYVHQCKHCLTVYDAMLVNELIIIAGTSFESCRKIILVRCVMLQRLILYESEK